MAAPVADPEVGQIFGRLTVTGETERYGTGLKYKRVPTVCECGTVKKIDKSNLLKGKSLSCGCFAKEQVSKASTTHGKCSSKIYAVWNMMKQRCSLPTNKYYEYYGGKGIKVSDSWQKFENFYADMGDPPFERATLDRIDNNKDYCKENVVWSTYEEQQANTSKTVLYDYKGRRMMLKAIAAEIGMNPATLASRIYGQSMSLEEAVSKPLVTQSEAASMSGTGDSRPYTGRIIGEKKYT